MKALKIFHRKKQSCPFNEVNWKHLDKWRLIRERESKSIVDKMVSAFFFNSKCTSNSKYRKYNMEISFQISITDWKNTNPSLFIAKVQHKSHKFADHMAMLNRSSVPDTQIKDQCRHHPSQRLFTTICKTKMIECPQSIPLSATTILKKKSLPNKSTRVGPCVRDGGQNRRAYQWDYIYECPMQKIESKKRWEL
jgi:hypothetical protein